MPRVPRERSVAPTGWAQSTHPKAWMDLIS